MAPIRVLRTTMSPGCGPSESSMAADRSSWCIMRLCACRDRQSTWPSYLRFLAGWTASLCCMLPHVTTEEGRPMDQDRARNLLIAERDEVQGLLKDTETAG